MGDKVLVIGSGGRESAIAWKFFQSPEVSHVYTLPGNPETERIGANVDVDLSDYGAICGFVQDNDIRLTFVGPEQPLVEGIVDEFLVKRFPDRGNYVCGPTRVAAMLTEGSKVASKRFMQRNCIPTARFAAFDDPALAKDYVDSEYVGKKVVVKASGLAAGKGVIVCEDHESAKEAISDMLVTGKFGRAGNNIVIEDFLEGEEASVLAFYDGKDICVLMPTQDHKAVLDGDKGPNTGGMGAYGPAPVVTDTVLDAVKRTVLIPTFEGLEKGNFPYKGCLYAGLMMTEEGPKVIEYNCRMGDPETQPTLFHMDSDFYELTLSCCIRELGDYDVRFRKGSAVTVVMAAAGYPGSYSKGHVIRGIDSADHLLDTHVFHAGTKREEGNIVTSGGRVLGVTSSGKSLEHAIARAYSGVRKIHWGAEDRSDIHYRKDIGRKGLDR